MARTRSGAVGGVYRRIIDVRIRYLAAALAGWSDSDFAELTALIDRLVDAMSATPFSAILDGPRAPIET